MAVPKRKARGRLLRKLNVLVFGAGQVWRRLIQPALSKLSSKHGIELQLHIVDLKRPEVDGAVGYSFDPGDMGCLCRSLRQGLFDVAIIATGPHETHSDVLLPLLDRVPLIICEKPVDIDLNRAQRVLIWIEAFGSEVFVTSHYCWKPTMQYLFAHCEELFERIGELEEIVFSLREPGPVEKGREKTLVGGLILDLGIHGFAIFIELFGFSAIEVDEQEVRAAQYDQVPEPLKEHHAETVADIQVSVDEIPGRIMIGKGTGLTDKSIWLRGSKGDIFVDIAAGELRLIPHEDGQPEIIKVDGPPPYQALLEAAILRQEGIPYRRGVQALELALKAKRAIRGLEIETYPLGTWPFGEAAVRA